MQTWHISYNKNRQQKTDEIVYQNIRNILMTAYKTVGRNY
jgi:hypothetical protein